MTTMAVSAALLSAGPAAVAPSATADEIAQALSVGSRVWTETAGPCYSFVYDGRPSSELLPEWPAERTSRQLDGQRTEHTVTYRDPATGLVVRVVAVEYADFATVEWTLHFENEGTADTPILETLLPLDIEWAVAADQAVHLRHNVGSLCSRSDFAPILTPISEGQGKTISAAGGRPTNSDMSYFNIEWDGRGWIIAVGWPGQWSASFTREANALRVRAGQELTHFRLHPGENARTPLVVMQPWTGGDPVRAQNLWRRWMMAHSMPRPGGALPTPALRASSSRAYEEMIGANEENQIMHIDRYVEENLGLDTWWMDAGWYVQEHGWPQVGTWEVDPRRFPNGLRPITDHAHAHGLTVVLWFEPERVAAGTWLATEHPEWVLGGSAGGLLNLGNPEAWAWLVEHVDRLIIEQGVDIYRQDFNMDPLSYWRANDAPDRQGMTEMKHVTGLLAFWDELLARHPNLLIDTCASGGRRIDLETLRRAVPLWRSDYAFEPVGHQGMTYGLAAWVPYHGTGTVAYSGAPYYGSGATPIEPYALWSNAAPSLAIGIDIRELDLDYARLRSLLSEWRELATFYYGDFYPLTPYSLDADQWIAWQFDTPEQDAGVVQAFRRDASPYEAARLQLRGLDPDATYSLRSAGVSDATASTGRELMDRGLLVTLPEPASAAVVFYRKQ